jgi:hypothetical protein
MKVWKIEAVSENWKNKYECFDLKNVLSEYNISYMTFVTCRIYF